jgi:hypothetical protein
VFSSVNPIVLEAFDHEHSHSLAVQVSPLNQDDLLLSFCNQYRCECLALVLREQVQRARGLVEEEYELLPHIAVLFFRLTCSLFKSWFVMLLWPLFRMLKIFHRSFACRSCRI